jgi:hypothetical protein
MNAIVGGAEARAQKTGESRPGGPALTGKAMKHHRATLSVALASLALFAVAACGGGRQAASSSSSHHHHARHAPASADHGAAAESAPLDSYDHAPAERPGLGTRFGERVVSHVTEVPFTRAGSQPFAQVAVFYNDAEGVEEQARHRGAGLQEVRAYTPHGGLSVALTDAGGRILPGFSAGGRTYIVGGDGQRYNLVIRNDTGGRCEVVASVDGLDVIDGRAAGLHKRGYIINPYSTLVVDGFRTSETSVAAFRFGAVGESYAARTGDDRNVGVVGFAFFSERGSAWTSDELHRRETADPFPNKYAQPPR